MLFLCEPFSLFLGTAPTNVIEWLTVLQVAISLVFTPFVVTFLCMRAYTTAQGTDLRTGLLSVCLDCWLDALSSSYSVFWLLYLGRTSFVPPVANRAKEQ